MTKQMQANIFKGLINAINEKAGTKFEMKDDVAVCNINNVALSLKIEADEANGKFVNALFDLTIDGDTSKKMTMQEVIDRLKMFKDLNASNGNYFECCFCKRLFKGYGNNPFPAAKKGKCCNECNAEIVIPARLKEIE